MRLAAAGLLAFLLLAGGTLAAAATPAVTPQPPSPLARAKMQKAAGEALNAGSEPITRPGPGYWLVGGDGGVFPFGRGAYEGGLARTATNGPIVGAAVTGSGLGYWLASSDGGVFAFGDARYAGSMAGHPHTTIIGIATHGSGDGYWLVGSDGGVFSFGGARFLGSPSGRTLSAPIVAVAGTRSGNGYWLVGADGAVYAYGDARYLGGLAFRPLAAGVTGMAVTATGAGYWLVGSDGGVYAFGDAHYAGSLSGLQHARIVGIAAAPEGVGYWLAGADGGVFPFGSAGYFGSVGAARLNRHMVGIASGDGIAIPKAPAAPSSTSGFDISWPQCDSIRPAPPYGFGIVGLTDGHLFSVNPCLREQWAWATSYGSFAAVYVNTNAPTAAQFGAFTTGEAAACGANTGCALDLWGRRGVDQALRDSRGIAAPMWWLDVETGNEWLPDQNANAVILRAMVDELRKAGKRVGIYSTSLQFTEIAGGYSPGLPLWVPGAPPGDPASYCAGQAFGGGTVWMSQSGDPNFDTDVLCAAGMGAYRQAFAAPAPLAVPQFAARPAPARVGPGELKDLVTALNREVHGGEGVAVLIAGGDAAHTGWTLILVVLALGVLAGLGVGGLRRVGLSGRVGMDEVVPATVVVDEPVGFEP